jgi:hypothetical protein
MTLDSSLALRLTLARRDRAGFSRAGQIFSRAE